MGVMLTKTLTVNGRRETLNAERFECSADVIKDSANRELTPGGSWHNRRTEQFDSDFCGVKNWQEIEEYMTKGYAPSVEKLSHTPSNLEGQGKRVAFRNNVVGFAPVVPLYLQGVPNCMLDTKMKVIKAKVINVYYDMTCGCGTSTEAIMRMGQNLLAAIMELEMQGYKFNLYSTQVYYERGNGADVLCVKIKNSNTPMNIQRMAFPLTHPAFFRGVGFDWYSRFPLGKYRSGYGRALGYDIEDEEQSQIFEQLFGEKCVLFTCAKALRKDKDYFKKKLEEKGAK